MSDHRSFDGSESRSLRGGYTVPAESSHRDPAAFVQGVPLKELFGVIRRHSLLVLSVVAISVVPVLWMQSRQIPYYDATAVVRLADARSAIIPGENQYEDELIGRYTDEILSQIQVLQGRTVLGGAVDRAGLRVFSMTPGFSLEQLAPVQTGTNVEPDSLRIRFLRTGVAIDHGTRERRARYGAAMNLDGIRFRLPARHPGVDTVSLLVIPRDEAIDLIAGGLRALPREGTDVVEVTFTSPDSLMSQQVVNAVAEAFQSYDSRRAQERSRRRRLFLERQARATDSLLIGAQNELSEFRRREEVYGLKERSSAQQKTLMELDAEREELAATERMYTRLFDVVLRTGGDGRRNALSTLIASPDLASNPAVGPLYTQLVKYEVERDGLVAGPLGGTSENPDVRRLNSLIAGTEDRLLAAIRSHLLSIEARLAALDELRAARSVEARSLPATEAEEERLMQNVASIGRVADQVGAELQQARMAEAVQAGRVEIVDLAPGALPADQRGLMTLILAGMLGLMLGSGGAFAAEAMNTSIRRPQEITSVLQVPRLAVVPRVETSSRRGLRWLVAPRSKALRDGRQNGDSFPAEISSHAEEAYRTLRANLIFSARFRSIQTLVVTSASPKEGKSTTVANLAVSFARQGFRVLLIDADLRRPTLHRVFRVPQEPGFSSILMGRSIPAAVVSPTSFEGLFFMPSGSRPHNLSELLSSESMRDVLARLRGQYDLLILDTPPVLAAAETAVLAAEADAVLVVIRAGQTERAAAEEAMQQLTFAGARVVGAVLNDPEAQLPRYGYPYQEYGEAYDSVTA